MFKKSKIYFKKYIHVGDADADDPPPPRTPEVEKIEIVKIA